MLRLSFFGLILDWKSMAGVRSWYYCCCWNILLVIQAFFFEWRQCICASSFLILGSNFFVENSAFLQSFLFWDMDSTLGKEASRKLFKINWESFCEKRVEWTRSEATFCFCWLIFFTSFLPRKLTFSQKTDSCKKTWTFSNSLILSF